MVVTTGAIRHAKLQSNLTTNTQHFTGLMPFLSPNHQCQSTEGKNGEPSDCDKPQILVMNLSTSCEELVNTGASGTAANGTAAVSATGRPMWCIVPVNWLVMLMVLLLYLLQDGLCGVSYR